LLLAPGSACTYGVVRERKVAITGLAIRASCRRFRITGCELHRWGQKIPRLPTRNLTEKPNQSVLIIGLAAWPGNLSEDHRTTEVTELSCCK